MIYGDSLLIFAVYDGALANHPQPFAVQAWFVLPGGEMMPGMARSAQTLEEARASIPVGLYRIDRSDDDHPAVIESWL